MFVSSAASRFHKRAAQLSTPLALYALNKLVGNVQTLQWLIGKLSVAGTCRFLQVNADRQLLVPF